MNLREKISGAARRAGRGQMAIVMVLVSLLFLLIMIPLIEIYVRNETRWSVAEKKKTTAFHIAEAGVDRGYWKLIEKTTNWDDILAGTPIALYDGTTTFTDIKGGKYKVWITSAAASNTVKILSVGMDDSDNEIRAVEAVYTKQGLESAIIAPGISGSGSFECHWGPMYATETTMDLDGSAGSNPYPIKRSKLGITGQTASCEHSPSHNLGRPYTGGSLANSNPFCTHAWYPADWYEWQAYDPDVPAVTVDLPALKAKAAGQAPSKAWETAGNGFGASRYIESDKALNWNNPDDGWGNDPNRTYADYKNNYYDPDSEIVRYIYFTSPLANKRKLKINNGYMEGALVIINGELEMAGSGDAVYRWPVPDDAWKQYVALNTAKGKEWPGDPESDGHSLGPPPAYLSEVRLGAGSPGDWPSKGYKVMLHGFLYVQGDYKAAGSSVIHGSLVVTGDVTSTGSTIVYYDPEAAEKAGITSSIRRSSWKEVLVSGF